MARAILPVLPALALACTNATPPRCPAAPTATERTSAKPAAPPATTEKDAVGRSAFQLMIAVKPVITPPAVAEVEIVARGPASDLDAWTIAAAEPDAIRAIKARDDDGMIPVSLTRGDAAAGKPPDAARVPLRLKLSRPPLGRLRLAYTITSKPISLSIVPAVEIDPDRFRALGEALIAVPDAAEDEMIDVALTMDPSDLGSGGAMGAASSFGVGASRDVRARARDLREVELFAGRMGQAVFDTQEGHDEAAWFGYTTFDPRPIAADVASFRTAVGQLFRDAHSRPATLFILPDGRPPGAFVASRRAGGVVVHVSVGEPWTGPVRIAVACEVIKAWIGERIWVGPAVPGREAEAYWFTEGVTRHLARDLLFRFGLLSQVEMLDEAHGLAGTLATSPWKAEGNSALAARAKEPGVLPLLVARGALYAMRTDALLRAKTGGKASLEDVVRVLYVKAREQRGPLPTSAWIDAVSKYLGPGEAKAFEAAIETGDIARLPDDALGPCFRGEARRYEPFDLGFEEEPASESKPRTAARVRAKGPADRAGLRSGDILVEARITRGRSDVPVTLTIEREGARQTITYRPAGPSSNGFGWVRRKDVGDEACVR